MKSVGVVPRPGPRWRIVAAALLTLAASASVRAAQSDGDAVTLIAEHAVVRDDNLFRLPDGVDVSTLTGRPERDETIQVTTVGFVYDQRVSRQRFEADLRYRLYRHDNYRFLDYDGEVLRGAWQGELGDALMLRLDLSRNKVLTDFADFRVPVRNLRTANRVALDAAYLVTPSWRMLAGAAVQRIDNSTVQRRFDDSRTRSIEAGIGHVPASGNRVDLRLRHTEGDYPNRGGPFGDAVDASYEQDDVYSSGGYVLAGASRLEWRLGHSQRRFPGNPACDFGGMVGRLAYVWDGGSKTAVTATYARALEEQQDVLSTFSVSRVLSLAPRWQVTSKAAISGVIEERRRDFHADSSLLNALGGLGLPARDDRTRTFGIQASYSPWRWMEVSLGWTALRRSAATPLQEFDARIVEGRLRVGL